ncbi:hypothetical protein GOP47_0025588 [Adiantum capillus-veneris]|uniref:Cystathionine beta-lyase n=1 Tax=Adiantum capillus-veneris TaxID=13818 RepID=A0A9D4U0M0_ADICA|nr:hypothetical protein GOP47_0025588 [Adiantum capillus-veneris]
MEDTVQKHGQDATICCHAGALATHCSNRGGGYSGKKAIWQASVYDFESLEDFEDASFVYRRYGCPNAEELGAAVASLEGAEAGLATSTGMGAIIAAVMSICKQGDLIIVNPDVYGVTYEFFKTDMERFGIEVLFESIFEAHILENILQKNLGEPSMGMIKRSVVVFLESITNPLVKVADISAIAKLCKNYAAMLVVDNTMATPMRMKPLLEGANLVVHSATKYLGGHDDLMAGVVVGSSTLVKQAALLAKRWGLTSAPFDAWLAIRGIHTLQIRMQRSWHSAETLSRQCLASGLALRVLSTSMCAILCIEVQGGLEGVKRAIKAFSLIQLSPSFGGTSTTVSHSATSSHKSLGVDLRRKLGISDGLLAAFN